MVPREPVNRAQTWHDPDMTQMSMGSNMEVAAVSVRASLRWTGGTGVPDIDASAILLEETGEVASDADFVFYNQPQHYSGSVRMSGKTAPPQACDQVDIDLARVPATVTRIVLAASADGGTFGQVPDLQMVLDDLSTGQHLAWFPMRAGVETAFVSAEIYRRNGAWRFRAVGQGYAAGLAGLAADFGIDTGQPEGDQPAPASSPLPDLPPLPPPPVQSATNALDLSAPESPTGYQFPTSDQGTSPSAETPPPLGEAQHAPAPPRVVDPSPPPLPPTARPAAPAVDPTQTLPPASAPAPAPAPVAPLPPPPPVVESTPPALMEPVAPPAPPPPPEKVVNLRKYESTPLVHSGTKALTRVVFSLGWAPNESRSDIDLDASVIAFDQTGNKLAIVWYMHLSEFFGALQHTGDNRKGGYGDVEQILVDLIRMPATVHSLVFTINSFRGQTFTDVRYASCAVQDVDDGEMLARFDLSDTQPSTALLMAELRRDGQGGWHIRAIGEFHDHRTVKKLVPAAARQVKLGR